MQTITSKQKRNNDQPWALEQENVRSKHAHEKAVIRTEKDAQLKAESRNKE